MARPKKPPNQLRREDIHIRLTSEEKEWLIWAAGQEDMDLTQWVRTTLVRRAKQLQAEQF